MSKRTVLVLLVICLCMAAVFAYLHQRTYNRFNTGEVTLVESRGSAPLPSDAPVAPAPGKKEPAGHPYDEPEASAAPSDASTDGQDTNADTSTPPTPQDDRQAATGRFQVYRQGDLTWRVDTESGNACVLFATDEEWQKPRVYRRACERD